MALIDIDLDEFSTVELVEELLDRMNKKKWRIGKADKTRIFDGMQAIGAAAGWLVLPTPSIEDQSKGDIIREAFGKYTSAQLEEKLK